ncbi:MAG: hypothetical protein Fur0021_20760 [Candidatus Promineifilaceae bacterium]
MPDALGLLTIERFKVLLPGERLMSSTLKEPSKSSIMSFLNNGVLEGAGVFVGVTVGVSVGLGVRLVVGVGVAVEVAEGVGVAVGDGVVVDVLVGRGVTIALVFSATVVSALEEGIMEEQRWKRSRLAIQPSV